MHGYKQDSKLYTALETDATDENKKPVFTQRKVIRNEITVT
jgi:hypothetical protein